MRYSKEPYLLEYFFIYSQLTNAPVIPQEQFINILKNLPENHFIFVCYLREEVVGMFTVLIEQKLTNGGKCIAHVEDVVVDNQHRGDNVPLRRCYRCCIPLRRCCLRCCYNGGRFGCCTEYRPPPFGKWVIHRSSSVRHCSGYLGGRCGGSTECKHPLVDNWAIHRLSLVRHWNGEARYTWVSPVDLGERTIPVDLGG